MFKSKNTIKFYAERQSVCMGDDCMAPHREALEFPLDARINDMMTALAAYVPKMKNVWWDVFCDKSVIGVLRSDESGVYRTELAVRDALLTGLPAREVFCKYNY